MRQMVVASEQVGLDPCNARAMFQEFVEEP